MRDQGRNRPLIGFTVLGPASVGALLGTLVLAEDAPGPYLATAAVAAFLLALLAVVLSLAHLDKPFRAYRALRRFPTSSLSREVAVFGGYACAAGAYAAAVLAGARPVWPGIAIVVLGAVAVLATAHVYVIPGRPAWRHWSTVAGFVSCALSLGPALALTLAAAWWPETLGGDGASVARSVVISGVALAAAAFWARTVRWNRIFSSGRADRGTVPVGSTGLWVARVVVGLVVPVVVLVTASTSAPVVALAALALLVGETADRTMFFAADGPRLIGSEIPGAR